MKRILAILCVIACLCALVVPAMAAGSIIVYVKAPTDWDQVYLYVWENDTPMASWPGTAMLEADEGWYFLEVPAGSYTNVIANNGDGKPQTADLKMEGSSDCWIVAEAGAGTVYVDEALTTPFGGGASAPTTGLPMALVGTGIPGAADWAPGDANGDMIMVSEGVYTKVVALTAGATMVFKVAGNDKWDDAYNFGTEAEGTIVTLGTSVNMITSGGSKDMTLTVDKDCNLKFTVTLVEGGATLLVEETDEEPTAPVEPSDPGTSVQPDAENVTIYAQVPEDWTSVYLWAWDDSIGDVDPSGWPGTLAMTKGDDGWWSIEIPGWATGILFHNGAGTQTTDLKIEAGKDVWVNALTDFANPVFQYEKIIVIEKPTEPSTVATGSNSSASDFETKPEENEIDNTVLLCIIGAAAIVVIAAVVIIIIKSKQKKA